MNNSESKKFGFGTKAIHAGQAPDAVAFTGQVVYLAAATRSTIFRASVPHLL